METEEESREMGGGVVTVIPRAGLELSAWGEKLFVGVKGTVLLDGGLFSESIELMNVVRLELEPRLLF